ncbi:hypothetical protein CAC42_3932 [Sphaceloma murrayae]|uniref:Uncharacterized protein n=1 Tax=Sphaceloma murrayae TaxID=2082308 RepID=A0A2K1QSW9_9PEZI|nr:hypothetical protein CAC42_3932 [Sphaceloma murrayae]
MLNNVRLCYDANWYEMMYKVENERPNSIMTIISNTDVGANTLLSMTEYSNTRLSANVNVTTYEEMSKIELFVTEKNVAMQFVTGSEPDNNTIRITNATEANRRSNNKTLIRSEMPYSFGKPDWMTKTIKTMNSEGMCLDCRPVHTFATAIDKRIDERASDESENVSMMNGWKEGFAGVDTTSRDSYLNVQ